jgi:hypothetical protein
VSSRERTFREYFWVDSDLEVKDLTDKLTQRAFADKDLDDLRQRNLKSVVGVLHDVARTEFDREMNLNTRGTAVAAVAGLIATASGAVGKSVFETTDASEPGLATIGLFLIGLVAVVAAMAMAVMGVLRPKKAPTRRMFFTDTLVGIWRSRNRSMLSVAEEDLDALLGDRLLQTIALWSVRNREKARWLRRAWLFLALGVLLISVAGLLVVSATLKGYSDLDIFAMVAGGSSWSGACSGWRRSSPTAERTMTGRTSRRSCWARSRHPATRVTGLPLRLPTTGGAGLTPVAPTRSLPRSRKSAGSASGWSVDPESHGYGALEGPHSGCGRHCCFARIAAGPRRAARSRVGRRAGVPPTQQQSAPSPWARVRFEFRSSAQRWRRSWVVVGCGRCR